MVKIRDRIILSWKLFIFLKKRGIRKKVFYYKFMIEIGTKIVNTTLN